MSPRNSKKEFGTAEALDLLLMDLLEQIKLVGAEEKEAPYSKLIELFFKGVDLKEKVNNSSPSESAAPQVNFICGVNEERI